MFPPTVLSFSLENHNHAWELMKQEDLSKWDALVAMAGDGLLYEVRTERKLPDMGSCFACCAVVFVDVLYSVTRTRCCLCSRRA